MKIAIIGCGYIGSALLRYWQPYNYNIVATTTQMQKVKMLKPYASEVYVTYGDDSQSLKEALKEVTCLVVCVAPKRKEDYYSAYLKTAHTLAQLLPSNKTVRQLIYTSSTSVYPSCDGKFVNEEALLQPSNESSQILLETENIYLQLTPLVLTTIFRLGGIYGPERDHEKRVEMLSGQTLPGSGHHFCNWVHLTDVVRAIDWALQNKLNGIYNICCEDHPTRQEMYGDIAAKLNLPPVYFDPDTLSLHASNKRVCCDKIKGTGFKFNYNCYGPKPLGA